MLQAAQKLLPEGTTFEQLFGMPAGIFQGTDRPSTALFEFLAEDGPPEPGRKMQWRTIIQMLRKPDEVPLEVLRFVCYPFGRQLIQANRRLRRRFWGKRDASEAAIESSNFGMALLGTLRKELAAFEQSTGKTSKHKTPLIVL